MSASNEESKIDLLDSCEIIKRKLNKAFCPEGIIEENGVLAFIKNVIMVIKGDKGEEFIIERPEKWGGNLNYKNYEDFEKDFVEKQVHPMDVKGALAKEIDVLLEPIREFMKGKKELIDSAYPDNTKMPFE